MPALLCDPRKDGSERKKEKYEGSMELLGKAT
jgi:hypothetical protein